MSYSLDLIATLECRRRWRIDVTPTELAAIGHAYSHSLPLIPVVPACYLATLHASLSQVSVAEWLARLTAV